MIPFPRSRREVTPLTPRVEEMLGNVARRSAPDGTLERILAMHASGSVYADVTPARGRILSFADAARFAIPAAAAAAAVLAIVPRDAQRDTPLARAGSPIPMVSQVDVPARNADLRVVNDPTLAS